MLLGYKLSQVSLWSETMWPKGNFVACQNVRMQVTNVRRLGFDIFCRRGSLSVLVSSFI